MGDLQRMPDIAWTLDGFLMDQSVSVLHGSQGAMKSFTALHIATVLAYGLPFLPDGPPVKRGIVLYVAFEGLRGFKARRLAAMRHRNLPDTDIDALKLINPSKETISGIEGIDFNILDAQSVMRFIMISQEIQKLENLSIRLVIVDVLAEALAGVESTKTFRVAAEHGRMIANLLSAHVMFLHHNKSDAERMRGPSNLRGHVEGIFSLTKSGSDLKLNITKQREGESGYALHFKVHRITIGVDADEKPIVSPALSLVGVTEHVDDATDSRLVQILSAMEPGSDLTIPGVVKLLGWSRDGRGGVQRKMVIDAVPEEARNVHLGGNLYRTGWRDTVDGHDIIHCRSDSGLSPSADVYQRTSDDAIDNAQEGHDGGGKSTNVPEQMDNGKTGKSMGERIVGDTAAKTVPHKEGKPLGTVQLGSMTRDEFNVALDTPLSDGNRNSAFDAAIEEIRRQGAKITAEGKQVLAWIATLPSTPRGVKVANGLFANAATTRGVLRLAALKMKAAAKAKKFRTDDRNNADSKKKR
jgi:hypothetical protein